MPYEVPEDVNVSHEDIVESGIKSIRERLLNYLSEPASLDKATNDTGEYIPSLIIPKDLKEKIVSDPETRQLAEMVILQQFKFKKFREASKIREIFDIKNISSNISDFLNSTNSDESLKEEFEKEFGKIMKSYDFVEILKFADLVYPNYDFSSWKEDALLALRLSLSEMGEKKINEDLLHFKSIFGISKDEFNTIVEEAAEELEADFNKPAAIRVREMAIV